MAKKPQRTPEQELYRDKLANALRNLRWLGQEDLAQNLLEREKNKDIYKDSQRLRVEVRNQCRDLSNDELKKLLRFIDELKRTEEAKPESLSEEAKPEQLGEEPMRVGSGEISIVDPHIGSGELKVDETHLKVVDNPDEEVQPNSNTESDEDKEKKNVWKCPNCGAEDHEPGAACCHVCGADFSAAKEEKEMEDHGQLRIDFESEEKTEQDENPEVEENGQLRISFENEEESENNEQ